MFKLGVIVSLALAVSVSVSGDVIRVFNDSSRTWFRDFLRVPEYADARAALRDDGWTLDRTADLTSDALAGADILLIPLLRRFDGHLTADEGQVIYDFIAAGHGVVFIGEHSWSADVTFHDVDNSVLNPLGLNQLYLESSRGEVHPVEPSHPITQGPYGRATSIRLGTAGIVELVPGVDSVQSYDPGSTFGTFDIGRGRFAFLLDVNVLITFLGHADNRVLWRNTFAYVPEPASTICLLALVMLVARHRR
jgi:hypothetical protein